MDKPEKKQNIERLCSLPSLSPEKEQLLRMINRDDISIDSLSQALIEEPSIAARIVAIANSAFYNPPQPISGVKSAIINVLGLHMTRALISGLILHSAFNTVRCKGFRIEQHWRIAIMTAMAVQQLERYSATESNFDEDCVYLAGLTHALGFIALISLAPEEMASICKLSKAAMDSELIRQEQQAIGLTHAETGRFLAMRWHLPSQVINTLAHLHDLSYRGDDWRLSNLVGVCAMWARFKVFQNGEGWPPSEVLQTLSVPLHEFEEMEEYVTSHHEIIHNMVRIFTMD